MDNTRSLELRDPAAMLAIERSSARGVPLLGLYRPPLEQSALHWCPRALLADQRGLPSDGHGDRRCVFATHIFEPDPDGRIDLASTCGKRPHAFRIRARGRMREGPAR